MRNIYVIGEGCKNKIIYGNKYDYKEAKGSSGAYKIYDILKSIQKIDSSLFNVIPVNLSINKAKGLIIDNDNIYYTNLEDSMIIPYDDNYLKDDTIIISTMFDYYFKKNDLDKIINSEAQKIICLNYNNINYFSKKSSNTIYFILSDELKRIYPKIKLDLSYEEILKSIMEIKYINNFEKLGVIFDEYLIYIDKELVSFIYYFNSDRNLCDKLEVFISGVAIKNDSVILSLKRGIRLLEGYLDNGYIKENEYIINAFNSNNEYNYISFEYGKLLASNSIIDSSVDINKFSKDIVNGNDYIKNILNVKINDLYLVSKTEVDEYKIINKLIKEYLINKSYKPLSFAIIGKSYNDLTYNINEIIKYESHKSYILNEDSFLNYYDDIKNNILKGITPLIFIKDYKGSKLLDDIINHNIITINYKEYVMGKSIFVLLNDDIEFIKKSSIINSIKGIYTYLGINAINENDYTYKIRRALFLKRINNKKIEDNLLNKLLEIDLKYEEKSLSSILEMSTEPVSFQTLPNDIFLSLHLDINELYNDTLSTFDYMMVSKKLLEDDYDLKKDDEIKALKNLFYSLKNINLKIDKNDYPTEFVLKLDELDYLSKINYEFRTNKKYDLLNDKEKAKERFNIKLIIRYLNEIKYEIKLKNVV